MYHIVGKFIKKSENFFNVCIRIGIFFNSKNCLGILDFILSPCPAATIKATFFILNN